MVGNWLFSAWHQNEELSKRTGYFGSEKSAPVGGAASQKSSLDRINDFPNLKVNRRPPQFSATSCKDY